MRIKNTTDYSTDDLRKFISVCARQLEVSYILNSLRVTIKRQKRRWWDRDGKNDSPSGRASLWNKWMQIRIPPVLNKRKLAFVVQHELYHTVGKNHQELGRELGGWEIAESDRFAFADNLPIGEKEANSPRPPRNLQEERHGKAVKKVRAFELRLKRTKTLLKKWQRKVKYYEKIRRSS